MLQPRSDQQLTLTIAAFAAWPLLYVLLIIPFIVLSGPMFGALNIIVFFIALFHIRWAFFGVLILIEAPMVLIYRCLAAFVPEKTIEYDTDGNIPN